MNLETERTCYAGRPRPEKGHGFGPILENGFYINYLYGLDYLCKKYITKNMKVLELGSFYGASSELFTEFTNDLTCVDIVLYPEMESLVKRKNINFIQSDSLEFLQSCDNEFYDLIYIDTTHDYGRTKQEIELSYSTIKHDGFLCGHDYNTHGVSSAILNTFKYPNIEVFLDSSWLIQKNNNLIKI